MKKKKKDDRPVITVWEDPADRRQHGFESYENILPPPRKRPAPAPYAPEKRGD